jgi:TonB family protein
VRLRVTIDRTGNVLDRQIVSSSGYPELDEAVMSMVERTQPLPPFPSTMPERSLDLSVPIRFSIQPASAEPTPTSTPNTQPAPTPPNTSPPGPTPLPTPIPPTNPSPRPSSNQQIIIVLQRPSVPGALGH